MVFRIDSNSASCSGLRFDAYRWSLSGYVLFKSQVPSSNPIAIVTKENPFKTNVAFKELIAQPDIEVSNIRFMDADPSDGQVEFAFDASRPMRFKGTVKRSKYSGDVNVRAFKGTK